MRMLALALLAALGGCAPTSAAPPPSAPLLRPIGPEVASKSAPRVEKASVRARLGPPGGKAQGPPGGKAQGVRRLDIAATTSAEPTLAAR